MVIAVVFSEPPVVLFAIFLLYAVSGPVLTLNELRKRRKQRRHTPKDDSKHVDNHQ